MSQRRIPLPPPWCLILLGAFLLHSAYKGYLKMIAFEEGQIDEVSMFWFMIVIYKTMGYWPTVILPFVAAGAIGLAGVRLQVRDLRARAHGEAPALSYEPVRWKGLLTALLVVVGVIAALIGLAILLRGLN